MVPGDGLEISNKEVEQHSSSQHNSRQLLLVSSSREGLVARADLGRT
jgi:hypothetical protein